MINASCHGCNSPMRFEAVPVKLIEMTGETTIHHGKDSAAWICGSCRTDPSKLKAARLAAGMPADAKLPAGFDEDEELWQNVMH